MNSPYVLGQSGTASPELVLVTIPPAKMSPSVEKAVNLEYRLSHICELLFEKKRNTTVIEVEV
tara:strand:+ start:16319 stop:16507 length:189 start_codon:yes stop_codon:yes gene_type:complete